jgi:undecaprenyl-diphosphatase
MTLESLDQAAWNALQTPRLHLPWLGWLLAALLAAAVAGVLAATAVSVSLMRRHGRRGGAVLAVVALLGAVGLSLAAQRLVNRPRPEVLQPVVPGLPFGTFPSELALTAAAAAGYLALAARSLLPQPRRVKAVLACATLTLIAGYAPMGLSINYLSDVLAGWAAGLVWGAACAAAARRLDAPPAETPLAQKV